jgi:hypothetical protein
VSLFNSIAVGPTRIRTDESDDRCQDGAGVMSEQPVERKPQAECTFVKSPYFSSRNASRIAAQRIGSAAAAGRARLLLNYCTFLANRLCARAAELLPVPVLWGSAGAGVGQPIDGIFVC